MTRRIRTILIVLMVIGMVALAGCRTPGQSDPTFDITGDIESGGGNVTLDGELRFVTLGENVTFTNVTAYFVSEEGTVVDTANLGSRSIPPEVHEITLSTETNATYIVVYSPQFFDHFDEVGYVEVTGGEISGHDADSRSQLPGFD